MTADDLKRYRARRDRRFDRAWWVFFLLGCLGVHGSAFNPNGATGSAWLILCGLSCMIVGREQYARRLAQADAHADLQAAQAAEAAKAAMAREALRAAELQAQLGQEDERKPPPP